MDGLPRDVAAVAERLRLGMPALDLAASRRGLVRPRRPDYLFEYGLVVTGGRRGPVTGYRWAEVETLTCDRRLEITRDRSDEVSTRSIRQWDLTFQDGTEHRVTLTDPVVRTPSGVFAERGVDRAAPAGRSGDIEEGCWARIARAQLGPVLAELSADGEVPFGAVTARGDGLDAGGRVYPWASCAGLSCEFGYDRRPGHEHEQGLVARLLVVETHAGSTGFELPASSVTNLPTLRRLLEVLPGTGRVRRAVGDGRLRPRSTRVATGEVNLRSVETLARTPDDARS